MEVDGLSKIVESFNSFVLGLVTALNTINTPWVAIIVIILGMYFALQSNKAGLPSDIASGVIGAGVGLLTGQSLALYQKQHASDPNTPTMIPTPTNIVPTPTVVVPADPAQVPPKEG
jgi:hypothetical protein